MQESIEDISILDYFSLENTDEYDFYIDILKEENKLCGHRFDASKITFNEFKYMISVFNDPNLDNLKELFIHLFRIKGNFSVSSDKLFYNESIFQFFKAKNYVINMMREKLKVEEKLLYSEPDTKMIEIGGYDMMRPFSTMLAKVNIGKQFGVDPEIVGNWKYTKVLNILATNNIVSEVQRIYSNAK